MNNLLINHYEELYHWGIKGMKWGVRKKTDPNGLTKRDNRWIKRNSDKITRKAEKKTAKELSRYSKELLKNPDAINKSGRVSASTINAYNRKMAELMNRQVNGIRSPSGKVVRYVAKRGEVGVMMALADQGYNMDRIKNGVYSSGKVAYKKTVLDRV
jgi:hypothetical protein